MSAPIQNHPHDWWLQNVDLWRCAKCGGLTRSPSIPHPRAKATAPTKAEGASK